MGWNCAMGYVLLLSCWKLASSQQFCPEGWTLADGYTTCTSTDSECPSLDKNYDSWGHDNFCGNYCDDCCQQCGDTYDCPNCRPCDNEYEQECGAGDRPASCDPGWGTTPYYCIACVRICEECQAGKYKAVYGTTACEMCSPGKFTAAIMQTTCQNCAAGKYSSTAGASVCTNCAAGKLSLEGSSLCRTSCSEGYEPINGVCEMYI